MLDLDDDEPGVLIGHATAAPLAALMAQTDLSGGTGAQLVDAVAVGIEVEFALGRLMNPEHYDRGWHATSTIGVVGAAAACARLLKSDAISTGMSLSMAASFSAASGRTSAPARTAPRRHRGPARPHCEQVRAGWSDRRA